MQAQFPQASSSLDFSHSSGYQSLNVEPSYPTILSKTIERLGEQKEKITHPQKPLKENSQRRGGEKTWKGLFFSWPYPWLLFEQRQRRRMGCCAEPAQACKPWERSCCHITLLCDMSKWSEPAAATGSEVKEFKAELFQNPPVLWRSLYLRPDFKVCSNPGFSSCHWERWILRNRQELIIWEDEVF